MSKRHNAARVERLDERLRYLALSTQDGLYDWDVKRRVLWHNEAMSALFGEEVSIDKDWWYRHIHPDDHDRLDASLEAAYEAQSPVWHAHYRIVRRDGSVRQLSAHVQILYDDDGKPERLVGALRDITEEKRTQAEVSASRDWLDLAVWGGELGVWDWRVGEGSIYRNERWARALGLPTLDRVADESDWRALVHPDDYDKASETWSAHVRGVLPLFEVEMRLKRGDGAYQWVLSRGKIVERDADGSPVRATGTHVNIDAQKRSELGLAFRLECERLVSSISLRVLTTPPEEMPEAASASLGALVRFLGADQASIYEVTDQTATVLAEWSWGQPWTPCGERVTPADIPWLWRHLSEHSGPVLFRSPDELPAEAERERAFFEEGGILSWAAIPFSTRGELRGALRLIWKQRPVEVAAEDIFAFAGLSELLLLSVRHARTTAELRRLNAELEERVAERTAHLEAANDELRSFSYSLSHDLRAPIRSIMGFARVLEDDWAPQLGVDGKDAVARIVRATDNLNRLLEGLLVLSRVSQAELETTSIDLSAMAQRIAEDLWVAHPHHCPDVVFDAGLSCTGDQRLAELVLTNLLDNAWKFTVGRPGPLVTVRARPDLGGNVVAIADNGIGFDMRYVDRLFRPFERLHRDETHAGTGIGLATVRRAIARMGGDVWAEGEVGVGATFFVRFPV
ncbi:MAG: PAS domain-containing protein [Fimbriimonadaceae bacterium]|nr:PAS domain-containing protein [Fimbriimonadaceae bacterium]